MPPARRRLIGLAEAAAAAELDPDDLLQLLEGTRAAAASSKKVLGPPEPTNSDWVEPVWDVDDYKVWALRMGYWSPVHGRRLIGYAGIAWLTDVTEQWLRKMQTLQMQQEHELEHMPRPVPTDELGDELSETAYVFFDLAATLKWARQTGRAVRRTTTSS